MYVQVSPPTHNTPSDHQIRLFATHNESVGNPSHFKLKSKTDLITLSLILFFLSSLLALWMVTYLPRCPKQNYEWHSHLQPITKSSFSIYIISLKSLILLNGQCLHCVPQHFLPEWNILLISLFDSKLFAFPLILHL